MLEAVGCVVIDRKRATISTNRLITVPAALLASSANGAQSIPPEEAPHNFINIPAAVLTASCNSAQSIPPEELPQFQLRNLPCPPGMNHELSVVTFQGSLHFSTGGRDVIVGCESAAYYDTVPAGFSSLGNPKVWGYLRITSIHEGFLAVDPLAKERIFFLENDEAGSGADMSRLEVGKIVWVSGVISRIKEDKINVLCSQVIVSVM